MLIFMNFAVMFGAGSLQVNFDVAVLFQFLFFLFFTHSVGNLHTTMVYCAISERLVKSEIFLEQMLLPNFWSVFL